MLQKNNRRDFIKISFATAALGASTKLLGQSKETKNLYPLPPGAVSRSRFKSKCTACQLCVNHCPAGVLKASLFENGFTGIMQPILKFDVEEYCQFECKTCIDVCPNDALIDLTLDEKKLTQIGTAKLVISECVVIKDNEDCGACAEHCPTAALKMTPYQNGLTQPKVVNPEICIGCGGCESICPTKKLAIYIERNDVHIKAEPPIIEKQEEIKIDSFGF